MATLVVPAPHRRGRRNPLHKRERRAAQRALRRAQLHLLDFVMLWADGAFQSDLRGFEARRRQLVDAYHLARRRVLVLDGAGGLHA